MTIYFSQWKIVQDRSFETFMCTLLAASKLLLLQTVVHVNFDPLYIQAADNIF